MRTSARTSSLWLPSFWPTTPRVNSGRGWSERSARDARPRLGRRQRAPLRIWPAFVIRPLTPATTAPFGDRVKSLTALALVVECLGHGLQIGFEMLRGMLAGVATKGWPTVREELLADLGD
jgi:hypothetical protein